MKLTLKMVLTLFAGFAAGIINGVFGTGGGIVLVFLLGWLMKEEIGYSPRDAFASVIAIVLPMSVVSAWLYIEEGNVSVSDASGYLLPAVLGGITGAFFLDKINLKFLKKLFALLVVYAGIKMMS
ncbi:MAG: sulfite exporter TauE/SafE family protein [Clostridia bacterium]|nr:sulfite exporter TauE/SafE family protein [Clostridia bacterium]